MENVITLGKLIGLLLLFCPPPLYFVFENSKNTRNELARPVLGTIFLVTTTTTTIVIDNEGIARISTFCWSAEMDFHHLVGPRNVSVDSVFLGYTHLTHE